MPTGAGIQLRLQPRAQRVDRQQREIDLDAVQLLERRRHLLDQAPVPRPVVADEHQLVGLALRQREPRQRRRRGRRAQQMPTPDHRPIPARRRLRCQSVGSFVERLLRGLLAMQGLRDGRAHLDLQRIPHRMPGRREPRLDRLRGHRRPADPLDHLGILQHGTQRRCVAADPLRASATRATAAHLR